MAQTAALCTEKRGGKIIIQVSVMGGRMYCGSPASPLPIQKRYDMTSLVGQ